MNLVGKTLCSVCNGYGHSKKICPTKHKLKHFSKAGISQTIIKRAKEMTAQARSRVNLGEVAPWSCLPVAGFKRPHKMVADVASDIASFATGIASKRQRRLSL